MITGVSLYGIPSVHIGTTCSWSLVVLFYTILSLVPRLLHKSLGTRLTISAVVDPDSKPCLTLLSN